MLTRREALAASGVAIAGGTAGCLDAIPFVGDEPVEFEATPASVPDSTLDETGYEAQGTEEVVVERTFEAGGQSQDVVVTNWQAKYDKSVDLGALGLGGDQQQRAAIFTALTTPQVEVLGRTFNPVADMDAEELAEMIQERYEGIDDLQRVGEETAPVSGQSTTVGEFETEAELVAAGATVDLTLHIAEAVESGEDLIVAVGGYPQALRSQEHDHVFAMMAAVAHGG
jgi:hypothetical protein